MGPRRAHSKPDTHHHHGRQYGPVIESMPSHMFSILTQSISLSIGITLAFETWGATSNLRSANRMPP